MSKQTKRSELTHLYQQIQLTFEERLHSLRLQVDSIQHNTQDLNIISQLTEVYSQWKSIRGNRLLQLQCRKALQSQRREELEQFQNRILEQRHSLSRKEQEIWQQSWNGKRIRYLKHLVQFNNEISQTQTLLEELALKSRLLQEIHSLEEQLRVLSVEEKKIDFKRIETAFIKQLLEENSKEKQLAQIQTFLASEFAQLSQTQRELSNKYKSLSQARQYPIKEQQRSVQTSAKSISTNSEEQISGD